MNTDADVVLTSRFSHSISFSLHHTGIQVLTGLCELTYCYTSTASHHT